ncbi:MAG: hypothetical protein H6667_18950 [Ardenticatenaceae bacterium]|nr:hypothetical protein [Ardenticatenaceae bacterium]
MTDHIVYQILRDLNIHNESDVEFRVANLPLSEIDQLLNKMDSWYRLQQTQFPVTSAENSSVFDIWIPTTPVEAIHRLSSNLLFAETVYLADPLYDYLVFLSQSNQMGKIFSDLMAEQNKHICISCIGKTNQLTEEIIRDKLTKIITFYLRSDPLVDSGLVIPYVDISPKSWPAFDAPLDKLLAKHDKDVQEFLSLVKRNQKQIEKLSIEAGHSINPASLPYVRLSIETMLDKTLGVVGVNEIFSNRFVPAPGIDFMGHISGGIIKSLYGFIKKKARIGVEFIPTINNSYLTLPTLAGVPLQELPEILYKERDSLEQFKEFLTLKIASISSPYGTIDWENEIEVTRSDLRHKLVELEKTLSHIKKEHLRRQSANIFTLSFSIGLASLALLQQAINPASIIQTVASGAGLTSSISSMIECWLDYRKDVEEQRRKDVYFLWRLQNHN